MSAINNSITRPVLSTACSLLIDNSPAEIVIGRLRLFYLMVISSGGLGGFAIETMRQLQDDVTDPAYRHSKSCRSRRS